LWHSRRGAGGAGSGGAMETRPGSAGTVEKTKPTSGPMCQWVDREKALRAEGVNQKRKHIFANTPMARMGQAAWADKAGFGLQEERGQQGWLGRRPSGPVRVAGPKVKKKDF
jgi:hypothetical protein